MPVQNVNGKIDGVSMEYFLRGVEAAKPRQPGGAVQQGADVQAQQAPEGAAKLVAQLDMLLLKAAKASTISLDGQTVQDALRQLVDDGVVDEPWLRSLQEAADAAAANLKALDRFQGRDLAKAFDADGHFNTSLDAQGRFNEGATKAGKAVLLAVRAQQEVASALAWLSKKLDRAGGDEPAPATVALRNKVDEFRQLCDRRATEIYRLASQMRDFAVHLAAHGRNEDPNVVAILDAKVKELLPRQALAMHGTVDALASVDEAVTDRLRPLAERIDAFRADPAATLDSQEFAAIKGDIQTMKSAIVSIRAHGVRAAGGHSGRMVVAKDIVDALETTLARVESRFDTARREVLAKVCRQHFETAKSLLVLDRAYEIRCAGNDRTLRDLLLRRNETLAIMQEICNSAADLSKPLDSVASRFRALGEKGDELLELALHAKILKGSSKEDFNAMVRRCQGIGSVTYSFVKGIRRMHGSERFFTGAEALGVFKGEIPLSTLVEVRSRGLRDEDVDPANDDANIVSERQLGSGAAGTVVELRRGDGTSVVFKGETESRTGLAGVPVGSYGTYDDGQQTINLNFATKKAAEALGLGSMIVNYSAGVHKGVFGFYMENAKGMAAADFLDGKPAPAPEDGLSSAEVRTLPADRRRRIMADIKRELNRLQWIDIVTGQGDRHCQNYFIHIDRTTHKVTIKGIDNDASYSQTRTGCAKFTFDGLGNLYFEAYLKAHAKLVCPRDPDGTYARMAADPGIAKDAQGHYTVDASRLRDKSILSAIRTQTGSQCLALPDKIDRQTYTRLVSLKDGEERRKYLDDIRPRLTDESYAAAVSRLDDAIAHAEHLETLGKVIEEDGWAAAEESPRGTGPVTAYGADGRPIPVTGKIAGQIHLVSCPSYYSADCYDKLFHDLH